MKASHTQPEVEESGLEPKATSLSTKLSPPTLHTERKTAPASDPLLSRFLPAPFSAPASDLWGPGQLLKAFASIKKTSGLRTSCSSLRCGAEAEGGISASVAAQAHPSHRGTPCARSLPITHPCKQRKKTQARDVRQHWPQSVNGGSSLQKEIPPANPRQFGGVGGGDGDL